MEGCSIEDCSLEVGRRPDIELDAVVTGCSPAQCFVCILICCLVDLNVVKSIQ